MSSPNSVEKRRLKDRKRNFNPRWEQDFAFINFEGRPLCLICNISLTHFKSCNLKRHYETHHKKFAIDYPPWSELRRNKLLALKMSRTNQNIDEPLPDHDSELTREAGQVIARAIQQSDRLLSSSEFCRQLIARIVVLLDPNNARLQHLIATIPLSDREETSHWKLTQFQYSVEPGQAAEDHADGFVETASPGSHQQVLADSLRRIEAASGCFICPICPLTVDSRSFVHPDANSSDPILFQSHLASSHGQLKTIRCVYCGSRVPRDQYTSHVTHHFLAQNGPSRPGVFRCPAEPECAHRFRADQFFSLDAHWRSQHADDSRHQLRFKCPHCPRTFVTLAQWAVHIQRYVRPLVHCSAPGCLAKSPSRRLIVEHVQKKHVGCGPGYEEDQSGDGGGSNGGGGAVLINETVEVVCGRQELLPSSAASSESDQPITQSMGGELDWSAAPSASRPKSSDEPKFVFLLRCPYCGLSTVRWRHFLSHAASCSGISPAGSNNLTHPSPAAQMTYRCRVYWCSACHAVSTEKNLVAEHATYHHDTQTAIYRETLNVKLLDSHGQNIPVTLAPAPLFFNPSAVSTLLGSNAALAPAAAATTPFAPLQFGLPGTVNRENEEDMESPMNLAALARPSASRCAAFLANRTSQLSTQSGPGLTTSQASSVVNDPSLSLLQSAAALKTLRDLTGGSTADVASLAASDTASAVAVMAALSGFTGFDVNNPIASASALTNIASSLTSGAKSTPNTVSVNSAQTSLMADSSDPMERTADNNKIDSIRSADDMVSFPFDETKFRKELSPHIKPHVLSSLVSKMHQFSSYFVRILGKENHRRIPVCPECEKVFPYGLGDFKRHLLTVHLEVPREYLKECLRFTYLPKSEEKFQEVQEQLAMRQMKPRLLDAGRRRVPLPYSIIILRRLTRHLPIATREFLEQKMQVYSRLSVIVDTRGGFRRYRCNHCNYSSPHALADVRKHILGSHCGISTKHFRHCLQASRLDPVEFTLFSDEKLARLAKDYMHRQHGSEAFRSAGSRASSPDDSGSLNGFTEVGSVASSTTSEPDRKQDGYVSHFTAVVPGSKNRVTVRIRPPVPPDASSSSHISSPSAQPAILSPSNGAAICSPATPRSPGSPDSSNDFLPSATMDSLDLTTLPSTPGFEGADQIIDLPLPYSEAVLRRLLEYANASPSQTEDVLSKMNIYSSYVLSRICRGDRVVAFRCPCGRLFATTRQPDSKIRAATLADARRHVMGVHARISHEYMTICCQASRLRREHDFQLYPDNMLLELATDRTTKLGGSPCFLPANRSNVSLPPLKPLRDLTPTSTPASKRPRLDDTTDPDNQDLADGSEAQSVTSSADELGATRDLTEEERSLADDRDSSDPNLKRNSKGVEDPLSHLHMAQASANEEVERIIDLPYSSEALHSLVMGYCPPNYFPVLEEKMDVYSSLKVFITRRRGRRYFCCSGCSSASPHGMGDIRKHILGVHAKVPERYKAAAMHCSRLSREDNTLLPNHVLLHLAKMKWKGTVIKPLAEIDLPQFGTRRASAVGLVRQTGQFASQVYQPCTQNRDTEKLTALPTTGANRPSNPSDQADYSLYDDLNDDTSVSTPNKRSPGVDRSTGSENGRVYIVRMNADLDQPLVHDPCHVLYGCSACALLSDYAGAVRVHVVREHLHIPAYRCEHCGGEAFATAKAAMAHHRDVHPELEFVVDSQLLKYRRALNKIVIKDIDTLTPSTALAFRRSVDPVKRLDSTADEDVEDADFLEEDELDPGENALCTDPGLEHGSSTKPSRPSTPPLSTPNNFSNGDLEPALMNGMKLSCSLARLGPSGSSRRKPSKLQLVQLKPTSMEDVTSATADSTPVTSNGDCHAVTATLTTVSTD